VKLALDEHDGVVSDGYQEDDPAESGCEHDGYALAKAADSSVNVSRVHGSSATAEERLEPEKCEEEDEYEPEPPETCNCCHVYSLQRLLWRFVKARELLVLK
jgi:hypothetical protein